LEGFYQELMNGGIQQLFMFWEEKIDRLKKIFPDSDFRNPFTDWSDILRTIEAKFIIKEDSAYHFTNWADRIKERTPVRTIPRQMIHEEIAKLDRGQNYWLVITTDDTPTAKHLVYDCKTNALEAILSMIAGDFYIVEKKYGWLAYFKKDSVNGRVEIIKSTGRETPFDAMFRTGANN
jgi:hypothetical protein